MTQIVTSILGADYGERHELLAAVDFERHAKIGCVMNDGLRPGYNHDSLMVRRIQFPPICARFIRNVELSSSFVLRKGDALYPDVSLWSVNATTQQAVDRAVKSVLQSAEEFSVTDRNTISIPEPVLITNNEGSGTWGHWVVHNLPRIALAKSAFPDLLVMVPESYYGSFGNFGGLLDQLGIPRDHLIPSRRKILYKLDTAVIVDYLYGANAIHPYSMDVFGRISEKWQPPEPAPKRRIAIRRTTATKREIVNQDEVDSCLDASGFEFETLGARKLTEQVEAWAGAGTVCSVLGSDLANIVFGRTGAAVMVLTPSWFGDNLFFDLAAARGLTWNELFCGQMGQERTPIISSSFHVDMQSLQKFVQHAAKD